MSINALYMDNWTVEVVDRFKEAYRLLARYEIEPDHCTKCGSIRKPYGHGPIMIDYVDAPVHGKRTTIAVEVKRYRCRDCGGTFMQPLPDMHPKRRMTIRCVEHIQEQGLVQTFAQIARDIGIDEKSVRDICNESVDRLLADHQPYAPTILGIDELHLLKHKRVIFTDVGRRQIIDLIEGMSNAQVTQWLYHLPGKERIQVVTMDMWGPYRDVVRGVLPNAVVVTDRWHLQKKANEVLDVLRNRQRRLSKGAARRNPWKARRLIQSSRKALSPRRAFILDGVLANNPLLSAAWHCKEDFYAIWDATDRADAEARFDAWRAAIPDHVAEFRGIAKTIDRWHDEVFSYFDYRFTNAYTEAANGLIKIANRAGRGYNNFKNIRAKAVSMPIRGKMRYLVCEECLGQIAYEHTGRGFFAGLYLNTTADEHNPTVCGRCRRFHIEKWLRTGHRPTLKSG